MGCESLKVYKDHATQRGNGSSHMTPALNLSLEDVASLNKVTLQTFPLTHEIPASLYISVLERQYPKILFENDMFTAVMMYGAKSGRECAKCNISFRR